MIQNVRRGIARPQNKSSTAGAIGAGAIGAGAVGAAAAAGSSHRSKDTHSSSRNAGFSSHGTSGTSLDPNRGDPGQAGAMHGSVPANLDTGHNAGSRDATTSRGDTTSRGTTTSRGDTTSRGATTSRDDTASRGDTTSRGDTSRDATREGSGKHGSSALNAAAVGGAVGAAGAAGVASSHGKHEKTAASSTDSSTSHGNRTANPTNEEGSAAGSQSGKQPVVEVIGIADRAKAEKLAHQTTRDLIGKGEDLLTGKVVINANTKEIYITPLDEDMSEIGQGGSIKTHESSGGHGSGGSGHGKTAAAAGAAAGATGAAAAAASGKSSRSEKSGPIETSHTHAGSGSSGTNRGTSEHAHGSQHVDAAFNEPVKEVDPTKFHSEHQKVRHELEDYAEHGELGNIGESRQSHSSAGEHVDAAFNTPAKEPNPAKYHGEHEKVKKELEVYAEHGELGNIGKETDANYSTLDPASPRGSSGSTGRNAGIAGAGIAGLAGAGLAAGGHHDKSDARGAHEKHSVDAAFNDRSNQVDPSQYHDQHERVKQQLEGEADKGHLGNVPGEHFHSKSSAPTGESRANTSTLAGAEGAAGVGAAAYAMGQHKAKELFNIRGENPEKSSGDQPFTAVSVLGESDATRARALATEAVSSLQGKMDVMSAKELKVDARTGAITDQDGQFLAQLGQRRLSQLNDPSKPLGGLVSPPSETTSGIDSSNEQGGLLGQRVNAGLGSGSTQKSSFQTSGGDEGARQNTQGYNTEGYNTASGNHRSNVDEADTSTNSADTSTMPGSFV